MLWWIERDIMAEKRDLYETLGIKKGASKDEIKSAYRKLAKKYHPDNHETGNADKFKEVQEAYSVLSDENQRKMYDQYGHAGVAGHGPSTGAGFGGPGGFQDFGGAGFDFGDIFDSIFGGAGGGFGGFSDF